jgi:PadR family transcriptional regulator, regulatory protein PadR
MNKETLKGHLDALLLATVEEKPAHGYAIIENLRRLSDGAFDLPEGTIYPALHRLEHAELLSSDWHEEPGIRRRRIYHITRKGHAALAEHRFEWDSFSAGVNTVLRGVPCTNPI